MTQYCRKIAVLVHLAAFISIGASLLAGPAWGQEWIHLRAKGPEGQTNLRYAFGGVFFVDKTLKEEYDRLLFRIQTLKSGLDDDRISSADSLTEAKEELKDLQTRLDRLRKEIEEKKTFISLGKIHKQTETVDFDLGPERLVVVTAKNVHVEGWDGPQVKCVLEKQVIVPDKNESTKVDEQLSRIKLVHKYGAAPETVGKTSAEREADEEKYLAGPEASKLTEKERTIHRLVKKKEGNRYEAFQGKKIDTIIIGGLRPDEGNRMIEMEISGKLDTKVSGSHYTCWAQELQRHASLTVYVPRCEAVALQDCEKGLIVKGVHGDLLVDGGRIGAHWNTTFQIDDLYGSLTVCDLPINSLSLSSIHGSVRFLPSLTAGFTWTSPTTPYVVGLKGVGRLMSRQPMSVITCKDVDGDFSASLVRANLRLEAVAGRIDVRNDYGDTTLKAEMPLAKKKHRLVSESGRIEACFTSDGLGSLPIQALTICGTIQTNAPDSVIENAGDAIWPGADGTACNWRGMISHFSDRTRENVLLGACKMMRAIVNGEDDRPAVDLLSRSGAIRILYEPKDKLKVKEN